MRPERGFGLETASICWQLSMGGNESKDKQRMMKVRRASIVEGRRRGLAGSSQEVFELSINAQDFILNAAPTQLELANLHFKTENLAMQSHRLKNQTARW